MIGVLHQSSVIRIKVGIIYVYAKKLTFALLLNRTGQIAVKARLQLR